MAHPKHPCACCSALCDRRGAFCRKCWRQRKAEATSKTERRQRQQSHVRVYWNRQAVEGFWVPCRSCGEWRRIHRAPLPSHVWRSWSEQVCLACARATRAYKATPPTMRKRQMVTGVPKPWVLTLADVPRTGRMIG